jgi:hypothetical protein
MKSPSTVSTPLLPSSHRPMGLACVDTTFYMAEKEDLREAMKTNR